MKKLFLAAAILAVTAVQAQQIPQSQRYGLTLESSTYENAIHVTGTAEREIVPNEITLSIVINEEDTKGKKSVEKQENDMMSALTKAGISTDKLYVGSIGSVYAKRSKPQTSKSYELMIGSAAELQKAVVAIESAGISNMHISKVSHSDIKGIQSELRIEAVKNAKAIATEMAEALGQKVGRAVAISAYNNDAGAMYSRVVMDEAAYEYYDEQTGESTYELTFKNITLNYEVSVTFELK